jgi:hypothetical protein
MNRFATIVLAGVVAGCGTDKREEDPCQAVVRLRESGGTAGGVKGFSKLGKGAMPTLLFVMTGDDTPEAIRAAEEAVALGAEALPGLTTLLESRAPRGRGWAAWALGRMGATAKAAIPALERAAGEPELKLVATEALARIGR